MQTFFILYIRVTINFLVLSMKHNIRIQFQAYILLDTQMILSSTCHEKQWGLFAMCLIMKFKMHALVSLVSIFEVITVTTQMKMHINQKG